MKIFTAICLAMILTGCEPLPAAEVPRTFLVSWEQLDEAGRIGAYGLRYDPEALTCATRLWPSGTKLKITEAHNGLSVIVMVTDKNPRGKYAADLSAAAFQKIDGLALGVAQVRIEVVE